MRRADLSGFYVYDPETRRLSNAARLSDRELYAAWRSGCRLINERELRDLIRERVDAMLDRERLEAARWN